MEYTLEKERFLQFAEEIVHASFDVLGYALADGDSGWMKVDKSYASKIDLDVERDIVSIARETFKGWSVVAEERNPNIPKNTASFISVDSLDGSSNYLAGGHDWSMSVGVIIDGVPTAGVVVQPGQKRAFAAFKGSGVLNYGFESLRWYNYKRVPSRRQTICTDLGPNSSFEYLQEMFLLSQRSNIKTENYPAVAGGLETLVGRSRGWWSYTAHHWDMAAIAALIAEMGGVVEGLDGTPLSWTTCTKLPPMLVAESPEWAERIRALITKPEANQLRLALK